MKTGPAYNRISIFYITDWNLTRAAKITTLVNEEKSLDPTLVIIGESPFSNTPVSLLNKGNTEIELLNNCGIDAVLLAPDIVKWGIQNTKELIKSSKFSWLGANVKDNTTNQPLGQEYLIKTLGKTQIAILGINYDSSNHYFKDKTVGFHNPEYTVLKLIPILENRSDFQFILARTQDSLDFPVDFIFGAPLKNNLSLVPSGQNGIYKLEISFDNIKNIAEIKRNTLAIDTIPEDSITKTIISRYQLKADSLLNIKHHNIKTGKINDWAIKTLTTRTKTLSFLSDQPLINKNFTADDILMADLYDALNEKDNLLIITIKGKELRKHIKSIYPPITAISDDKNYQILSTIGFLKKNTDMKYESIEISDLAVWEILSYYLKD